MWRWNNHGPQRTVRPSENRFTDYAVQRDGDVVLTERERSGCAVVELRRSMMFAYPGRPCSAASRSPCS